MENWKQDRIASAIDGTNPMVMCELRGGFAVYGDTQFLPGYSVILPKREVASLNDLSMDERILFLQDMSLLGDAILNCTKAVRVNYDILGNTDNFLHAHVFPSYISEPKTRRLKPVWLYDSDYWTNQEYQYNPDHDDKLKNKITKYLNSHYNVY